MWCGTSRVCVNIGLSATFSPSLFVVLFARAALLFVDNRLLPDPFSDGQVHFHLERDIGTVRLWVFRPIIPQTMPYRLIDSFDEHIVQCVFVIDIYDLIRLCNKAVGKLLRGRVCGLHVSQDCCTILVGALVCWVFLEEIIHHFWIWTQWFARPMLFVLLRNGKVCKPIVRTKATIKRVCKSLPYLVE